MGGPSRLIFLGGGGGIRLTLWFGWGAQSTFLLGAGEVDLLGGLGDGRDHSTPHQNVYGGGGGGALPPFIRGGHSTSKVG